MSKKFIMVKDKDIIDKMKNCGFVSVYRNDDYVMFINNPPKNFNFDSIDKSKLFYTNKMFF